MGRFSPARSESLAHQRLASESTCKTAEDLRCKPCGRGSRAWPVRKLVGSAEGIDGDNGDWAIINEESQEVEPITTAPSPTAPSPAEIEEHRLTHIPFRNWCRECMMGRGLGEQRGRHRGRDHLIAIVGLDYFYITSNGLETREDIVKTYPLDKGGDQKLEAARRGGQVVKCLIIRCFSSKNLFAHVVPCKGSDEDKFVVGLILKAIAWGISASS